MKNYKLTKEFVNKLFKSLSDPKNWRYDTRSECLVLSGSKIRITRHLEVEVFGEEVRFHFPIFSKLLAKWKVFKIMRYLNNQPRIVAQKGNLQ